jgi:RNA polymerase subunit RPABC4/transcription elongation factor Spt4
MQMFFTIVLVLIVVLYVLSIVWVARDAYLRGTVWYIWAIVALVPFLGVIAYLLMRPPLLMIDKEEQELEVALKQRQLMNYGECAACGYPVEADYIICPHCHTQLKNMCPGCRRALEPAWSICPFCATTVRQQPSTAASRPQSSRRRAPRTSSDVPSN